MKLISTVLIAMCLNISALAGADDILPYLFLLPEDPETAWRAAEEFNQQRRAEQERRERAEAARDDLERAPSYLQFHVDGRPVREPGRRYRPVGPYATGPEDVYKADNPRPRIE